ncbi:MAG: DUF1080 domain-containing protein [Clostridia bacterium]|nr:DUF1080 domain-containing protein [Clostridia bacterium]
MPGISSTGVVLGKQNYSWTALNSYSASMEIGKTYHLKVEAYGANIKVYLDGELVIDYTDPDPYITGAAGVRCHNALATFDNFKVSVK